MSRKAQLLALLGLVCVWVLVAKGDVMKKPRGIRNNNPGNIRPVAGTTWTGQIGDDGGYLIFDRPETGIRALAKLLSTYRTKYGINTIKGIITRWAPASENDTISYIAHVSQLVGVHPEQPLDYTRDQLLTLVKAIIQHENGQQPYTEAQLLAGIQSAGWMV